MLATPHNNKEGGRTLFFGKRARIYQRGRNIRCISIRLKKDGYLWILNEREDFSRRRREREKATFDVLNNLTSTNVRSPVLSKKDLRRLSLTLWNHEGQLILNAGPCGHVGPVHPPANISRGGPPHRIDEKDWRSEFGRPDHSLGGLDLCTWNDAGSKLENICTYSRISAHIFAKMICTLNNVFGIIHIFANIKFGALCTDLFKTYMLYLFSDW